MHRQITELQLRNLVYCDFQDPLADKKLYVEVDDWDKLALIVEDYLTEYNELSRTPMNLVLFRFRIFSEIDMSSYTVARPVPRMTRFSLFQIRDRTSFKDLPSNDATSKPCDAHRRRWFRSAIFNETGRSHFGL